MIAERPSQTALQQNFANIRSAVENRAYDDLPRLLAEQRFLVENLSITDPEERAYMLQALDLTFAALAVVKTQRAEYQQQLSTASQAKQVVGYEQAMLKT